MNILNKDHFLFKGLCICLAVCFLTTTVGSDAAEALSAYSSFQTAAFDEPLHFKYCLERAKKLIGLLESELSMSFATVGDIYDRAFLNKEDILDLEFDGDIDQVYIEIADGLVLRYYDPSKNTRIPEDTEPAPELGLNITFSRELAREILFCEKEFTEKEEGETPFTVTDEQLARLIEELNDYGADRPVIDTEALRMVLFNIEDNRELISTQICFNGPRDPQSVEEYLISHEGLPSNWRDVIFSPQLYYQTDLLIKDIHKRVLEIAEEEAVEWAEPLEEGEVRAFHGMKRSLEKRSEQVKRNLSSWLMSPEMSAQDVFIEIAMVYEDIFSSGILTYENFHTNSVFAEFLNSEYLGPKLAEDILSKYSGKEISSGDLDGMIRKEIEMIGIPREWETTPSFAKYIVRTKELIKEIKRIVSAERDKGGRRGERGSVEPGVLLWFSLSSAPVLAAASIYGILGAFLAAVLVLAVSAAVLRVPWKKIALTLKGSTRADQEDRVPDARGISGTVKDIKNTGQNIVLGGEDLSSLSSDEEVLDRIERYAVIPVYDAVELLRRRARGEELELFDSVFDPLKALEKKVSLQGKPLNIVHVRGGRGASGITQDLARLARKGLIELKIIPGAVDDGRSWADMALYFNATGVPDMGKSYADMGRDAAAVEFAGERLVDKTGEYSKDEALDLLKEFVKAVAGLPHRPDANIDRLMRRFRELEPFKQNEAAACARAFEKMVREKRDREGHDIDIRSIPMRSVFIVGAKEAASSWQGAVDSFGKFVDASGQVILPTEKRLHAMAFLEDGTFLPAENALNELEKNSEYLALIIGAHSFVSDLAIKVIFLVVKGRFPREEEKDLIEKLRKQQWKDLHESGATLKILSGKSREEIAELIKILERELSWEHHEPAITVQKDAVEAFAEADIIMYGPTDIESNIASAVMYGEISEAVRGNKEAMKLMIANADDNKNIEPAGTSASSMLERLYRYLSGQQRFRVREPDFRNRPVRDYIQYKIGRARGYGRIDDGSHIDFDEENIRKMGVIPVGMDLEMSSLGDTVTVDGNGFRFRKMEPGKYNPSLTVTTALSLFGVRKVTSAETRAPEHKKASERGFAAIETLIWLSAVFLALGSFPLWGIDGGALAAALVLMSCLGKLDAIVKGVIGAGLLLGTIAYAVYDPLFGKRDESDIAREKDAPYESPAKDPKKKKVLLIASPLISFELNRAEKSSGYFTKPPLGFYK
ncbi:MAG: hypothetical protein GF408_04860, partial [Candidatus Omnitrophica bacterium]|nr:hypothetical protein [Candidatus Omnitrophota bacterium]